MWFCPLDGTLLKVDREESTNLSTFLCTTCPYSCPIVQKKSVKTITKRKEVDDILGGQSAWGTLFIRLWEKSDFVWRTSKWRDDFLSG